MIKDFFLLYTCRMPYDAIYDLKGLKPVPIDGSIIFIFILNPNFGTHKSYPDTYFDIHRFLFFVI